MLSKVFLKKIEELLLLEKSKLTKKSIKHADIDTDGDETDEVQANMLIEMENQLSSLSSLKLNQINDALKRLADNTYGKCQECEEPIAERRLEHSPYFTICVSCAEERENEMKHRKRF